MAKKEAKPAAKKPAAKKTEIKNEAPKAQQKNGGSKKAVTGLVALAVLGGGYFAYTKGLIPGLESAEQKTAKQLKKDIENMQGNNIEETFKNFVTNQSGLRDIMPEQEYQKFEQEFTNSLQNDLDINFSYQGLETKTAMGKGSVEIIAPTIAFNDLKKQEAGEITVGKATIARDAKNPNHFYYSNSGDMEVYANVLGEKQKMAALSYQDSQGEIKLNEQGETEYVRNEIKDLSIVEGRGNTTLFKIGEIYNEQTNERDGDEVKVTTKAHYKDMEPGDMMKLMFGPVEPVTFAMDYEYEGDSIITAITEYQKSMSGAFGAKQMPESPKIDASMKLNDISLTMGEAGVQVNGSLNFEESRAEPIPDGSLNITLANYDQIIELINKFVPMPQGEVDNTVNFLKEIGTAEGNNINLTLNFDGTENITVGGKSMAEIMGLQAKYFAPAPSQAAPNGAPADAIPAPTEMDFQEFEQVQ